jgi:hypothetical protein
MRGPFHLPADVKEGDWIGSVSSVPMAAACAHRLQRLRPARLVEVRPLLVARYRRSALERCAIGAPWV